MMPDSDPIGLKTAVDSGHVETTVIEPITCLVCGCLCDDIRVVKLGESITEAGNACGLGSGSSGDTMGVPGTPYATLAGSSGDTMISSCRSGMGYPELAG